MEGPWSDPMLGMDERPALDEGEMSHGASVEALLPGR